MTTTASGSTPARALAAPRAIGLGAIGGIAGGFVFGALMAMQGMLPMVAALAGSDDALVGMAVHLAISAAAGLVFGIAVAALPVLAATPVVALAAGAAYGVVLWAGGALVAMPMLLGMSEMVLVIDTMQLMSLMGHMAYGVVTGLVLYAGARRA